MPEKEGQEQVGFLPLDGQSLSVRDHGGTCQLLPHHSNSTAYFHSSPVGPLLSPLWGWENNYKMKVMPVHQGKSSLSQHQEVAGCESMGLDTGYLVSSVALEGDVGHLAQLPGKNMLS